jgi:hypothetical protein
MKYIKSICVIIFAMMISQQAFATGQLIGEWEDTMGKHQSTIQIVKEGDKYFMLNAFTNGKSNKGELFEIRQGDIQIFKTASNRFGEFYVIDDNEDLDMYDGENFMREAKRIR